MKCICKATMNRIHRDACMRLFVCGSCGRVCKHSKENNVSSRVWIDKNNKVKIQYAKNQDLEFSPFVANKFVEVNDGVFKATYRGHEISASKFVDGYLLFIGKAMVKCKDLFDAAEKVNKRLGKANGNDSVPKTVKDVS